MTGPPSLAQRSIGVSSIRPGRLRNVFKHQRPAKTSIDSAPVLSQRDLSPSGSVYHQSEITNSDIPTHTDLLHDTHIVRTPDPNEVFADFDGRGVLNKRHLEIQYGPFSEAVAAHDELDPSNYRETRSLDWAPSYKTRSASCKRY